MKVVGMQSWKVWLTLTAIINPHIKIKMNCSDIPYEKRGVQSATIVPESESNIRAILFTCRPGRSPVATPMRTPRKQNSKIRARSNMNYSVSTTDIR